VSYDDNRTLAVAEVANKKKTSESSRRRLRLLFMIELQNAEKLYFIAKIRMYCIKNKLFYGVSVCHLKDLRV